MRGPIATFATIALLAVGASGCGDEETTTTSTVTETTEASTSTTSESTDSTVTESTGVTTTAEDGAPPPADQTVKSLTGFTSPSGNIGCFIDRTTVRCDVRDRDWKPPPPPAGCQLDYGQGISLDAGSAPEFVCAGDTTLGSGPALPYGQSIAAGLLRCESEKSGMTCRDAESGRGFTISQQEYQLF